MIAHLDQHVAYPLFIGLSVLAMAGLGLLLRVGPRAWLTAGLFVAVVSGVAWVVTERVAESERERIALMLKGFGPTYAIEMESMGHARLTLTTPRYSPLYTRMIEAQKRWLATNLAVADVYTMRRLEDGTIVFMVDSETDYNRDGDYDDEREERTALGEVYEDVPAEVMAAFGGATSFNGEPETDAWGTWVSAAVPIRDSRGRIEAVLGVDYPAADMVATVNRARLGVLSLFGVVQLMGLGFIAIVAAMRHRMAERRRVELRLRRNAEELAAARDAAETANRAKSEFLANMSHEIRTPMTAILGYAEMIGDGDATHEQVAAHVDVIRRNGRHLLSILNDVLDLSKIEAQRMTVERIEADPSAIVEEVASLTRPQAVVKGVELRIARVGRLPAAIRTDPLRLRQIVTNLVGNAIKFTEKGAVTIELRMEVDAQGRATLHVAVRDTGIGMTHDQVGRLFTPFSQADASTTRRFGGTGLGLTIAQRMALMLDGQISVRSAIGQGSTFDLMLRLGPAEALAMEPIAPPEPTATTATSPAPSANPAAGRILVVDDGIDNQRLIHYILTKQGYDVDLAGDGEQACAQVLRAEQADRPYDLVVMDVQMPHMDGLTATRYLRGQGYTRPILALTAHAMGQHRDECLAAGYTAYESKPINRAQFLATVWRLLDGAADRALSA